jgi:acyl-coenzyme A thioesterase PaaI-like protein
MALGVDEIPQGYAAHFRRSPVTEPWEPLFSRVVEGTAILAIRIRQAHCNGKGFLHGGVVSALADNAMIGLSLIETLRREGVERGRAGITVNL